MQKLALKIGDLVKFNSPGGTGTMAIIPDNGLGLVSKIFPNGRTDVIYSNGEMRSFNCSYLEIVNEID